MSPEDRTKQFIDAWNGATRAADAAKICGLPIAHANRIAHALRLLGWPLQKKRSGSGQHEGRVLRSKIRSEAFMQIWNTAENLDIAAELLGMSPAYAKTYASRLRGKGLPVRKFSQGRRKQ